MSTQLHLVDPTGTPSAGPRRARIAKSPKGRRTRWHTEWRLDDRTRRVGQEGVAAARQALAEARRPEQHLPRAS